MKLDKIIFLVDSRVHKKIHWQWTREFSKLFDTRLMIVHFVNRLGGKEEDSAWQLLYSMEDEAFDEEIKVSLFVEKKEAGKLKTMIEAYDVKLVITAINSGYLKELKGLSIPLLLLP